MIVASSVATLGGDVVRSNGQPSAIGCSERAEGYASSLAGESSRIHCAAAASIPVADGQFLGREQRDHTAAFVRHHDLLFDAGGGIAVGRGTIGLKREHHSLL